jgi:hypothetical protein
MDSQRRELEAKREMARGGFTQMSADYPKDADWRRGAVETSTGAGALVAELKGRKWNEFGSWLEFMRWTVRLRMKKALEEYEMPDEIGSCGAQWGC